MTLVFWYRVNFRLNIRLKGYVYRKMNTLLDRKMILLCRYKFSH